MAIKAFFKFFSYITAKHDTRGLEMELIKQKVFHKTFGEGVITEVITNSTSGCKHISVRFAEKHVKFQYPQAFKVFLKILNPELESMINDEIKTLEDKERLKEEEQKALMDAKPKWQIGKDFIAEEYEKPSSNKSGKALHLGDSFGTNSKNAYLRCCEWFGWDKSEAKHFGQQGALLYAKRATPEGFSPWFVSNHNLENTKGGKWSNTIEGEFIYEEWDESDTRLWEDKTIRVVFLKLRGNYRFFGLYQVDNIELKGNGKYTKTYKRASEEYYN